MFCLSGSLYQALIDSNLPRLQLELYKEIKKVCYGVLLTDPQWIDGVTDDDDDDDE